jgi:hypothetical protein
MRQLGGRPRMEGNTCRNLLPSGRFSKGGREPPAFEQSPALSRLERTSLSYIYSRRHRRGRRNGLRGSGQVLEHERDRECWSKGRWPQDVSIAYTVYSPSAHACASALIRPRTVSAPSVAERPPHNAARPGIAKPRRGVQRAPSSDWKMDGGSEDRNP